MVRMAMGDKRARGRTRRINPHVCRLHIDAMRVRLYPMLGGGSGDVGCPFLDQNMGRGRRDVNRMWQRKFTAAARARRNFVADLSQARETIDARQMAST
jgi:hypothetical protein